ARLAEEVRCDDPALVLPDVGQLPDAVDVADRPEALARAKARVDGDAARVGSDADALEADSLDARAPAGRGEEAIAAQRAAVVELERVVLALAARAGRVHAERDFDAVPAQDLGEGFAEASGLAAEQVLAALDECDFAAEATHGLRHFHADRPSAEHEQPAGHGLHARHLPVRPDALEAAQTRHGRDDR